MTGIRGIRPMAALFLGIVMIRTTNAFYAAPVAPVGWRRPTGLPSLGSPRSCGWALRAAGREGDDGDALAQKTVKIPAAVAKEDLSSAANPMKNMAGQVHMRVQLSVARKCVSANACVLCGVKVSSMQIPCILYVVRSGLHFANRPTLCRSSWQSLRSTRPARTRSRRQCCKEKSSKCTWILPCQPFLWHWGPC